MVEISSARFAVTPGVTFSFEKECGSEKSRLHNISGSLCSTRLQETVIVPLPIQDKEKISEDPKKDTFASCGSPC